MTDDQHDEAAMPEEASRGSRPRGRRSGRPRRLAQPLDEARRGWGYKAEPIG